MAIPVTSTRSNKTWHVVLIVASVAVITALHYSTSTHLHTLHGIHRRFYYLPIVYAAFVFGLRGGLACSVAVSLVYIPHAFFASELGLHADPAGAVEKMLEIAVYNGVALVAGLLVNRERREKERHERTAADLAQSMAELESIQEQLLRAEKLSALGHLGAGLAHEIRNPLGSIRGTAEILADDYGPGSRKYEMAQILLKEVQRVDGILTEFLSFARPAPIEKREADLIEVVEGTVKLVEPRASEHPVVFRRDYPAGPMRLTFDPERMRQVFLNILLNAVQAMPSGGSVEVRVRRAASPDEERAVVEIEDSGPGIPPERMHDLFDPFYSTKPGGTGLGLPISHRIVTDHGGTIRVASPPGSGAVFIVSLPMGGRSGEKIE